MYRFISGFIQTDIRYNFKFYITFKDGDGYALVYCIILSGVEDLNRFVSLNYDERLAEIKLFQNRIGGAGDLFYREMILIMEL